jgi:hypothetical protein
MLHCVVLSVILLLVNTEVLLTSAIFVTVFLEAIISSETSVHIRVIRRNFQEYSILPSHHHEGLKLKKYLPFNAI